jgi:mannose-6-phosphate isomerase-like protein (cupin superfamily)
MHEHHGTPIWVIGHKLTSIVTTGAYAFADVTVSPGVPGPPPHYHAEAEELYYVVEGTVEFMRGNTWHAVGQGKSFRIPKGTMHSFRSVDDQPGRFITIHDPGGPMDTLFLTFGIPVEEPNSFERSVSKETIAAFAAAAGDHDMIIPSPEPA